jgi:hypothetical protein
MERHELWVHYHANGPGLGAREWRNASADQGGNGGDIKNE